MGLFLNFGAGPNSLPPPWQNLNAEHDIRKALRFEAGAVAFILAEHVIEHAQFLQGYGFLSECHRVLRAGGVLRLAFPDVSRFVTQSVDLDLSFNYRAHRYADALAAIDAGAGVRGAARDAKSGSEDLYAIRAATVCVLAGFNHQAMWTREGAAAALLSVGFASVREGVYGRSIVRELDQVDGHAKDVGDEVARLETTILEAVK